jgi:hypothetical protein
LQTVLKRDLLSHNLRSPILHAEDVMVFWKLFEKVPADDSWKKIDQEPIPVGAGRIWLADKDGNVRKAMAWTWRVIKRREPGQYQRWMKRAPHTRQPSPEAMKQLAAGD